MKPFDLEKALSGEPVKLVNGSKAYVLHQFKHKPNHLRSLLGYKIYKTDEGKLIESSLEWFADGSSSMPTSNSIIGMWEEQKPKRFINGIEVPEPVTLDSFISSKEYWFVDLENTDFINKGPFYNFNSENLNLLNRGLVFMRKEEAETMAKALFNYKVEVKNE